MEAPPGKMNWEDLSQHIASYLSAKCDRDGDGFKCKQCGSKIKQTTCYVSIHSIEFRECGGRGKVKRVSLPYCPQCEGEPKNISTCVHVPTFSGIFA